MIIEDNGPDMTDDQFASLRNLGQSSKKDGLGLGLAIVRELLEANRRIFETCQDSFRRTSLYCFSAYSFGG